MSMRLFRDFISLFFPEYCLMCTNSLVTGEECICLHCQYALPLTNDHLLRDNTLSRKFAGKVNIKYAWAYLKFIKKGTVQHLLHQLKYHNKQEVGKLLGKWYGNELKSRNLQTEFDLIIPVPLHMSRLKKRGYNQCESIVEGLSEAMGIPYTTSVLVRSYANKTQTKLGRLERYENTKKIFKVLDNEPIVGNRILLVDDVVTTGATLVSCAEVILEAGCRDVSIVCLAVAQ